MGLLRFYRLDAIRGAMGPFLLGAGFWKLRVDMRERLWRLLEPWVSELGYELVEIEYQPSARSVLRVYIDHPTVDADPITVEDCERVSRAVSEGLDESDPIPGEYALEVSSPGFDRPLRTLAHFARFAGERVKVETLLPKDGRKRWTGDLVAVKGELIELNVDGQTVLLEHREIKSARIVPTFG
jgi:ribosome maturation factor RimP